MKKKDEFEALVKRLHVLLDEHLDTIKLNISALEGFPTGYTNIIPAKMIGKTLMIWGSNCKEHPTWLVKDCPNCATGEWIEVMEYEEDKREKERDDV